jgi:hypothetical protein
MAKICMILLLLAVVLVAGGCCSNSGSREFVPGKGWVPT